MTPTSLADRLREAFTSRTPIAPLTQTHPGLTLDDAYTIQAIGMERRRAAGLFTGAPTHPVGRKVGITSRAVQEWLGVSEPDFGVLLDEMEIPASGSAPITNMLQPRVEAEIAFVLRRPLAGPGVSVAQAIAAVECVLPAIEIIDSRIADWTFRIEDTVADNASSAMFTLGTRPTRLRDIDLPMTGMTMRKNGRVVSTGAGAACLGNPINALVWLANRLGPYGESLNAGDVILSGALGPVSPVAAGDAITAAIGSMGEVSVRFT